MTQLHPMGVLVSLDVFGVMAWQRQVDMGHTGQDIVKMAKHSDVISPMIYPSHFFGMDGYDAPGRRAGTLHRRFHGPVSTKVTRDRAWCFVPGSRPSTGEPRRIRRNTS